MSQFPKRPQMAPPPPRSLSMQTKYRDTPGSNLKYKKKYSRLKRKIKALIFENAALCDEVAQVQENILIVKEERKFLFKKLLEYEGDPEPCTSSRNSTSPSTSFSENLPAAKKTKRKSNSETESADKFMPISLGNLTVYSLGEITDKPLYHTEDAIYPVGFVSTRIYGSMRDPLKKCIYTCKITDGGNEPRFEIVADSDFESPIVGSSPDYCHSMLLQYINDIADMTNFSIFPNGAKFFGLSHTTIAGLIHKMASVKKCTNYKWMPKIEDDDDDDNDPTINFDSLQRCIMLPYHSISGIKEEPPDDMLHFSDHH